MFTGIIEETGTVRSITSRSAGTALCVNADKVLEGTVVGESIAVNGVCLTVTSLSDRSFTADVMPETVRRTSLARLIPGAKVNLERAMLPTGRLGGHIVSGHVDGCGHVDSITRDGIANRVTISLEPSLLKYIAQKGSVTVDGVSLTVVAADDRTFAVSLIPQTRAVTTLGELKTGSLVNVEVDVLARYTERLLTAGLTQKEEKKSSLSLEWLQENGF
ncbi:MAG: riboflavin synthase [Bacteroidales bacterium]|nr:riboflavin synthase [Bacteroidales bacterium]